MVDINPIFVEKSRKNLEIKMDTSQNEKGWIGFVHFWKIFFAAVAVGLILLAFVAL